MEWRAILAVVLSIFVLVLWQYVFVPVPEAPQQPATPERQEKPSAGSETAPTPSVTRPSQSSTPGAGETAVTQAAAPQSLNERLQVANFRPSAWQLTVTEQQPQGVVSFEYQDPSGWHARSNPYPRRNSLGRAGTPGDP